MGRTTITDSQLETAAKIYGIELPLLKAFLEVESAGSGFFTDWYGRQRIKIQFEPHWYKKYTKTWINNGVRPQQEEWKAFNQAFEANKEAAMLSTSWGLGQVMGFNYAMIGFQSVGNMVDWFKESEYNQLLGMLSYCRHKKGMLQAMKDLDFNTMAYLYNGSQYRKYNYHTKLKNAYKRFKAAA